MPAKPTHIVLAAIPAMGHIRPLCVLAARIVNERPDVVITLLASPTFLDKTLNDIARQADDDAANEALKRIRVAAAFQTEEREPFKIIGMFCESYGKAYETLIKEEPLICAVNGTKFDALPAPTLAILDFFGPPLQLTTQAMTPNVPVLAWVTGGAASLIRLFGPESLGGIGDLGAKIDEEVARSGRSAEEIGDEILEKVDGSIVQIAGLPPMYDWEQFPQILPFQIPMSTLLRGASISLNGADGIIIGSSEEFEHEPLEAYRNWIAQSGRSVYVLGPLLPSWYGKPASSAAADKDTAIESFLKDKLSKHGERSLLFISFGTVFWPTVQEHLEELVEVLLENQVPFFFCHASPFARIPDELVKRVEASGLGLLSSWAPQQMILNHPVTGWYLNHGGHGGVTESLGSGIPLIFWPFHGDQPATSLHVSDNLGAGLELLEVRTGLGLKPLKRNGKAPKGTREAVGEELRSVVRDVIKGDKGKEMTKNAQRLKVEFANAWLEGGSARTELRKIFEKYL